ncbi:DUF3800 domain-containing protein [Bradyrhizobium sp. SZCCHNRI20481]|uniref:DUF3800 domain-containing protein n=1 Tax=Bradyrhizobium sp. SZCCHNRI20481 TaxID=3057286 RepID=UPI00291665E4|nr:DUF3800 domain-containing protein [Bradyrhizobium sp. SZCCHNRI20481]
MAFSARNPTYIAFIDETGDHGIEKIDPKFPVFAICAVTMTVEKYVVNAASNLTAMKYYFFGHECVVIHGHKIRKKAQPFLFLKDPAAQQRFMEKICYLFDNLDGHIVAAAIDKPKLVKQYSNPTNPFFLSLQFVLERLHMHWSGKLTPTNRLLCVFEERGGNEDARTLEWFTEICSGNNFRGQTFHFEIDFKKKAENVGGHQYADLAAYTVARFVETGDESRKDWTVVKKRIRKSMFGNIYGYGLKVFP